MKSQSQNIKYSEGSAGAGCLQEPACVRDLRAVVIHMHTRACTHARACTHTRAESLRKKSLQELKGSRFHSWTEGVKDLEAERRLDFVAKLNLPQVDEMCNISAIETTESTEYSCFKMGIAIGPNN